MRKTYEINFEIWMFVLWLINSVQFVVICNVLNQDKSERERQKDFTSISSHKSYTVLLLCPCLFNAEFNVYEWFLAKKGFTRNRLFANSKLPASHNQWIHFILECVHYYITYSNNLKGLYPRPRFDETIT